MTDFSARPPEPLPTPPPTPPVEAGQPSASSAPPTAGPAAADATADDPAASDPIVYNGQFGPFIIDEADRREVKLYRAGIALAALSFGAGTALALGWGDRPETAAIVSWLYLPFSLGLGLALLTIHIYLGFLHRLLQAFWLVGTVAALTLTQLDPAPLALAVYQTPQTLWGIGWTFAALTGIAFKEAFCFNRFETKLLTPAIPLLMLGHLFGWLPLAVERALVGAIALLLLVFAARKLVQPIPPDIGDKSVFEYFRARSRESAQPLNPRDPASPRGLP